MKIDKMHKIAETVRRQILNPKREKTPNAGFLFLIVKGDEAYPIVVDALPDQSAKLEFVSYCQWVMHQLEADAYFTMMDIWTLSSKDVEHLSSEEFNEIAKQGISEHPNRVDAISFYGESKENYLMRTFEIVRDNEDCIMDLVDMQSIVSNEGSKSDDDGWQTKGLFTNLLDDKSKFQVPEAVIEIWKQQSSPMFNQGGISLTTMIEDKTNLQ